MKRMLIGGVVVLGCVLALELVGLGQNNGVTTDPEISAILSNVEFQPHSKHSNHALELPDAAILFGPTPTRTGRDRRPISFSTNTAPSQGFK
jgi:hypothetical protein